MKKILNIALLIGTAFSVNTATAQRGLSLNVKVTPQFSFLQNSDDKDAYNYSQKATFNANFGIGAAYNFTSKLGIGTDVLYSTQGQRYELSSKKYYQKTNYLKTPVYLVYNSNPSKKISFMGKIGPQVSFITSAKLEDNDGNELIGDNKDGYKSATFGAMAVAGIQYKVHRNLYLTSGVRFDYDFTNAEDDTYADYPAGRAKTYNMTTGLEVGLKYVLGK